MEGAMKGFRLIGDYALEFLVITLLVALSAATAVMLIPVLVGGTGYFQRDINSRRFKDISQLSAKIGKSLFSTRFFSW